MIKHPARKATRSVLTAALAPLTLSACSIAAMAGETTVSDFMRLAAAEAEPPAIGPGMGLLSLRHEVVP
jgi:uncharacterized lipoprotein